MALVLFNIGWMQYYRGQTSSDRIINGGSYVRDNETGGEIKDFLPLGDWCYAYVQPPSSKGTVNLERLGASPGVTYVDDVTIVFTATPPWGCSVVVGWYRDARVWRDQQQRRNRIYYARARKENCTLLGIDERALPVPRAGHPRGTWGIGQSNIRYVDEADEGEKFVRELRKYMQAPSDFDLNRRAGGGGPRQSDPVLRAKVEKAAIECVTEYYKGKGYECVSVEPDNKGWDLEFTRGAVNLLVEVKGCSGDARQVELTPNEYAAMLNRHLRDVYRLAVVTRALDKPRLSIVSFNGSDKTWRDQKNREVRLDERKGVRVTCR